MLASELSVAPEVAAMTDLVAGYAYECKILLLKKIER